MTKKAKPLISLILPAYNSEEYLEEAIISILNQSFKNFEFIIVNDASTDNTQKIIKKYAQKDSRVKFIKNEIQKKIAKSLNIGIEKSSGKYIARMDSDDWAYPERLKLQFDFLEKNPDVVIVGGAIEVCDGNLKILNSRKFYLNNGDIRKHLFKFSPFSHPTIMMRREALNDVGGYDVFLEVAQDYDLYFRLATIGALANLKNTVLKLRTHSQSASAIKGRKQEIFTLVTRIRSHVVYGFRMSWGDKIYFLLQLISMFIIPTRVKFWIFNKIRSLL